MRPWDGIVSEEEQRAYRAAGFGRPGGMGDRLALVIIDVQYRTTGTTPRPFFEAVEEFPTSCGDVAWTAVGWRRRSPISCPSRRRVTSSSAKSLP